MFSKNIKCPFCESKFYLSEWDEKRKCSLEVGDFKIANCPECGKKFEAKLCYFSGGTIALRSFKSYKKIIIS